MTRLILPGLGGSGPGHWQRWWLAHDADAVLIEQPDWDRPDLDAWLASLADALEQHPRAILVAHSLACALVAHLAVRRRDLVVGGALLVAPADVEDRNRMPPEVVGFAPLPFVPLPFPSIVVASSNDPFVSIGRAMLFSHAWGSSFVHLRDSGHINTASGYGAWPDGLRLATRLAARATRRQPHLHLVQAGASALRDARWPALRSSAEA